jgi:hypothetical protein
MYPMGMLSVGLIVSQRPAFVGWRPVNRDAGLNWRDVSQSVGEASGDQPRSRAIYWGA